jgi:PhoPQ-activated pathogenicity-related protein
MKTKFIERLFMVVCLLLGLVSASKSYARGSELEVFKLDGGLWPTNAAKAWQHNLKVKSVRNHSANPCDDSLVFLMVRGGRLDQGQDELEPLTSALSGNPFCIVAELDLVPNQPITVADHKSPLIEDGILAYSMRSFLKSFDANSLALMAMRTSAQRAMDFIEAKFRIARFVIAGQSKRGWTCWLTAIADKRVHAVVPMVIDFLNIRPSLRNHKTAYGDWAPPLNDYREFGILDRIDSEAFGKLAAVVDPYEQRQMLTMPKFLVNAANDQFFTPDSSQFYYGDLVGQKFLRYLPNTGHHIDRNPQNYYEDVAVFARSITRKLRLPSLSAVLRPNQSAIDLTLDNPDHVELRELTLWQAHNPVARDFRLDEKSPRYAATVVNVKSKKPSKIEIALKHPKTGWHAAFVSARFDVGGQSWQQTSQVFVFR